MKAAGPGQSSINPTILLIVLQPPNYHHYLPSSSPSPAKKRRRQARRYQFEVTSSSPLGPYASKDYYDRALRDFTDWCANKYQDEEFREAFEQLQKHKIGVDLLGDMDAKEIMAVTGITHGTAIRLQKNLPKWKTTLSNVIYLNITMTKLIPSQFRRDLCFCNFDHFIGKTCQIVIASNISVLLHGFFNNRE